MAKALRNIDKLAGKSYKSGDEIPDAVISKISPQVLRSLVEARTIEVPGMEAAAASPGGMAHIMARLDKQGEQIKKLEARLSAQEGKTAAPAKPAKNKTAAADTAKA